MKRFLRNLLIAFAMLFMVSCGTTKETGEVVFGTSSMMVLYTMDISQYQLDSICTADILPYYDSWLKARFTDYETNTVFVKRMYLKACSEDEEIIYILIGEEEPYKITKRIAE